MMDIAEPIFLAIDEIVKRRLEDINYDTTIICTIEDNSQANNYKYICSNGSASFEAYANDTSYKLKESVQVTIPNNDYNNQKYIIGRYIGENSLPFSYTDPFSQIIDASGNLVQLENNNYISLMANGEEEEKLIWTYSGELVGFKRLGLSGDFRSWIYSLNPVIGSYGYRLEIDSEQNALINGNAYTQKAIFYLDSLDMFGNPFNFQTFFNQQKIFDISNLDKITNMRLYFYQKRNSFIDGNNQPINLGLSDNLFTKDPYICLGYDLNEFDKEQALLFSANKNTYIFNDNNDIQNNQKIINLRWLHQFEDNTIKVVNQVLSDWEIRWYRFNMGAPSADEYSGVYWERLPITKENFAELSDLFTCIVNPRATKAEEQIKVIILSPDADNNGKHDTVIRSNIITFKNEKEVPNSSTIDMTNGLSLWCKDNSYGNYFVYGQNNILFDKNQANLIRKLEARFASNNLIASEYNVDELASPLTEATEIIWKFPLENTMIKVNGFDYNYHKLFTDIKKFKYDGDKGKWTYIVKEVDYYDCFDVTFNDKNEIETFQINEEKLKNFDIYGQRYAELGFFKRNIQGIEEPIYDTIKIIENDQGKQIVIHRLPDPDLATREPGTAIDPEQDYLIKSTYNASALYNTVECIVKKNSLSYTAIKQFNFGLMGTNGTDATLVINFDNNQVALTSGQKVEGFKITAHLYDYNHREVDFNDESLGLECEWSWYKQYPTNHNITIEQRIKYKTVNEKQEKDTEDVSIDMNTCFLHSNTALNINNNYFLILQVKVKNWGNYDLIAYKAIPIRSSINYSGIIGADEIIYSSAGTVDYYKGEYQLYYNNNLNLNNVNWTIYDPWNRSANDSSLGIISTNNILKPATIYFKGSEPYGVKASVNGEIVWLQPLVILQNNYPSGMINEWDGQSIVLDDDEGQLIAPVIAAGRKINNKFYGVMMGDLSKSESENELSKRVGIFGFHEGSLSFGFEDNGTAFIGKSGKGQILLDGNDSVIQSSNWKTSNLGMFMDLDEGIIEMHNTGYIFIDSTAPTYPLSIGASASSASDRHFKVKWDGSLEATDAYIKGDIYADYIEANDGEIGGWQISPSGFTSPDGTVYLYSNSSGNQLSIKVGDNFNVTANGIITAYEGTLGGWTLDKTKLAGKGYGYIYLYTDSPAYSIAGSPSVFWRIDVGGKFGVDRDGNLYTSGNIYSTGTTYIDDYFYIRNANKTNVGNIHGEGNKAIIAGQYLEISATNNVYLKGSTIYFDVADQKLNLRVGNVSSSHPIYAYFA